MPAVKLIFSDAFSAQAVAGGAIGTVIRYGVARGVFSNEAGMGSAPIAAAAAKTDHPVRQALVSMTGTFLDTIVVCSITGIVLVMGLLGAGGEFVKPGIERRGADNRHFPKNAARHRRLDCDHRPDFLCLLNHSRLVLLRREMRGLRLRREVCRFVPRRLCFFGYAGNRVEP